MSGILARKKIEIGVFILILLGLIAPLEAKVRIITSTESFERIVGKSPYVIAMFYQQDRDMRKSNYQLFTQNGRLQEVFKSVSERGAYQEAGIEFLSVNLSKNRLMTIAQDYGFMIFPVFALFKNGMPAESHEQGKAFLKGFVSAKKLHEFIGSHWNKDIEIAIKKKQEERKELERERALYAPAFSIGWGYPYGGWGYPYGGWYGRRFRHGWW